MAPFFSALVVAAAIVWSAHRLVRALSSRKDGARDRVERLLAIFAPAVTGSNDARTILAWQPLAAAARQLFPTEFAALDAARGAAFPFNQEQIRAAHARWTADWLAWELAHDAECKLKRAAVEHELGDQLGTPYSRARLEALEREKLDRYQRRYEEYTRVSKALQVLIERP